MTESILLILLYIAICILSARRMKNNRFDGLQIFFINLILTPIAGLLLSLFSGDKDYQFVMHYKCPRCSFDYTEELSHCLHCAKDGHKVQLSSMRRLS